MKQPTLLSATNVSSIELFYDVMLVYCLRVLTGTMHQVEEGLFTLEHWLSFTFSYMVILQVWVFAIFLMNRFGNRTVGDNLCLLANMFLLYYIASSIESGWENSPVSFAVPWAFLVFNLIIHCLTKRLGSRGLDADDKRILDATMTVLTIQLAFIVAAIFLPEEASIPASWMACVVAAGMFTQSRTLRSKPASFEHLATRCSLITIIAFGEMVASIASYVASKDVDEWWIFMLVFTLVVGLFLVYMYEHDRMIDHHAQSDGMMFLLISAWIIFVVGNITVALEYMAFDVADSTAKVTYLTAGIVLYFITSFMLGRYNKKEFTYSKAYIFGRILACIFIIVPAAMGLDPLQILASDTVTVYIALWYEWLLYHSRTQLIEFAEADESLRGEADGEGPSLESWDGRRTVIQAYRASRKRDDSTAKTQPAADEG